MIPYANIFRYNIYFGTVAVPVEDKLKFICITTTATPSDFTAHNMRSSQATE
jgi:hypothetical protein